MPDKDPIVFEDMIEREKAERRRLEARKYQLERAKKRDESLHPDLEAELREIKKKLEFNDKKAVLDPLFKAAQKALEDSGQMVADHLEGRLPSQQPDENAGAETDHEKAMASGRRGKLTEPEKALAVIYGILERENQTEPPVFVRFERNTAEIGLSQSPGPRLVAIPDTSRLDQYRRFSNDLSLASGEYYANRDLFNAVLPYLVQEGDKKRKNVVRAEQWAAVTKILVQQGVQPDDEIHLGLRTKLALESLVGGEDGPPSNIVIDLPDLEEATDTEIVVENLYAMQAIYFSMMLDELKVFQVVDKLVELFQMGMLPFGRGPAGDFLYNHWKRGVERISDVERNNVYARAFGAPVGESNSPNREFNDLWLRFVSAVSSFVRQLNVDDLLGARIPASVSQEQVRKAGRDLAANLSLHGYGISYFVATDLQDQIKKFIALLSDKDVKNAYGARDMWQVVDQVATLELGGARNSTRYRTMANAGAIVIRWLADRSKQLAGSSFADVLNLNEIRFPPPRPSGEKATTKPTDADLVNACEQWLAVTGTQDARVEEYSQPSEGPNQTSRPVQIPSVAKDLLESVGIQAGFQTNGGGRY